MFDVVPFHVLLLGLSALATLGLAGYALAHRDQPGAIPFSAAMGAMTIWTASYAVSLTQTGGSRILWERMQWLGVPLAPILFFLFILAYTGHESRLSTPAVALLFVVPLSTVALVWTNPAHHLVWTEHEEVVTSGLVTLVQEFGPWFWVNLAYNYALVALGAVLLVRLILVSDYLYVDQAVLLVVGILAPLVGNFLSVFGLAPVPGLDMTPYAFTVTGIAFGNAFLRYRLFDFLPATRQLGKQAALSSLDDGVVIVGDDTEILYLNETAADIFGCPPAEAFGDPLEHRLDTSELDFESGDAFAELSIADRTYEVTTAPITDQHDRLIGHTVLLHDVTSRERRERTLRRQRDELVRLERLNRVIRNVNGALVGATSRADVARAVCETLVADGPYAAAWVGIGPSPATEVTGMTATDEEPRRFESAEALPSGVTLSGADTETADLTAPGEQAATSRTDGGRVTVPLVHGRTVYGVLVLESAPERDVVGRERDVLAELGETIGHAVHAIEQRQLLVADAAVELEFRSTDPEAMLVALSEEVGPCTLDGLVPGDGGALLAYVSVDDATASAVTAALSTVPGVSDVRPLDSGATTTVEVSLTEGSLCCPLVEYGAHVRSAVATDGSCTLLAEVSSDAAVRSAVDRVTEAYPSTELHAKRELSPLDGSAAESPMSDPTDLTERQREVLEAAYRAGYFEWPRESTAEEVAASLDIASPTLHSHLRKAENRILSEFFEAAD